MKEGQQPPTIELENELVRAFSGVFLSRWDKYSFQRSDGRYVAIQQPLTLFQIAAHLRGIRTLGAYALNEQSQAQWICLDADDEAQWRGLIMMSRSLKKKHKVPTYLELSRRGGHLWLFLSTPLPGQDARRFGKRILKDFKLENVELYPKQDELQTGPGSLVRLPLGIHQKDGKRYHFVTPTGEPLAPTIREQLQVLAAPLSVPPAFVESVLKRAPLTKRVSPTPRFSPLPKDAYGGKPSERIKHSITVFDFVSKFVDLDRRGHGLCPFHDDHMQSFSVNQERNYWHCFAGCGGGSVIDFWMHWRELKGQDGSFPPTVAELRQILGLK